MKKSDEELQSFRKKVNRRIKKLEKIQMMKTNRLQSPLQSQLKQKIGKSLVEEAIEKNASFSFSSYLPLWPEMSSIEAYLPSSFTSNTPKKETNQKTKPVIKLSRQQIDEKTINLVNNLRLYTSTDPGYIRRLQDFCKHLSEYPEARGVAIQHEAIGQIQLILSQHKENIATKLQANEALAILGMNPPISE